MSGVDGKGLCSYGELRDYLKSVGEDHLLKYVREINGRFELVDEFRKVRLPSMQYQIACVFMLLGEYTVAEEVHRLRWSHLSAWGDKVGNNLLKHFMKAYP
jgi:hypothetical protein